MVGTVQNKSNLFIIGAGGFGREIETWLYAENIVADYNLIGYLDDNPNALEGFPSRHHIVGSPLEYNFDDGDKVILAISDPLIKEKIVLELENRIEFYSFISKTAIIGDFNSIGKGSIICPRVIITNNVNVGEYVTINIGAQIGHDVIIKDYSSLMPHVDIGGKCIIEPKVFIGTNATVIPSRIINQYSKIGAASMVIRNVPEGTTVVGNPAKRIK